MFSTKFDLIRFDGKKCTELRVRLQQNTTLTMKKNVVHPVRLIFDWSAAKTRV